MEYAIILDRFCATVSGATHTVGWAYIQAHSPKVVNSFPVIMVLAFLMFLRAIQQIIHILACRAAVTSIQDPRLLPLHATCQWDQNVLQFVCVSSYG